MDAQAYTMHALIGSRYTSESFGVYPQSTDLGNAEILLRMLSANPRG